MDLTVSAPPHLKTREDTAAIMWRVCLALVPAFAVGFYAFGWYALFVTALAVGACLATEAACQRLRSRPVTLYDGSAVVSGLLLAAVLPPNVPWYLPVAGGVFAMAVAKHAFGGLGTNIWNPALLARAFLGACFASWIFQGEWVRLADPPDALPDVSQSVAGTAASFVENADVVTGATVLADVQATARSPDAIWNSLLGVEGGCIAEVSALALLVGGLYLLYKRIITWEIPVVYLASVGLLSWVLPQPLPGGAGYTWWCTGPWLVHLMGGGLMIGAFFMATDMVTTPLTVKARVWFALGCGVLTVVIRLYAGYPEGVCYSILIMNTCVPLLDAWTRPVKFGASKPKQAGG